MVQIRRVNLSRHGRALGRGFWHFLRFLLMAGLMPSLFVVRMLLLHRRGTEELASQSVQQLRIGNNNPNEIPSSYFQVLSRYQDFRSDVVVLSHCRIDDLVDATTSAHRNFTRWAYPLLNTTLEAILKQTVSAPLSPRIIDDMRDEFVLQLLEMYTSMDLDLLSHDEPQDEQQLQRRCDYSRYTPTIPDNWAKLAQERVQQIMDEWVETSYSRIVFTIVAHNDVLQLERLISAIYMPQHLIVIHMERRAPIDFIQAVNALSNSFPNVVVLRFGTIVYRTDLVSHVHWQMMNWFHHLPGLDYDYHIALDGSSYPLQSAAEMLQQMEDRGDDGLVYLGELTHAGRRVRNLQEHIWKHKRLIYTRGSDESLKYHKRLSRSLFSETVLPQWAMDALQYKSVSGNQAVLHRTVVEDLLESVEVRELFAKAKYGCCCCFEERTWVAALHLTGYGPQALRNPSMFQIWGGESTCGSSMHNAFLTSNASQCYRVEDATVLRSNQTERNIMYFYGNETIEYLFDAKDRGFMFARKFQSGNEASMQMLQWIRRDLWQG